MSTNAGKLDIEETPSRLRQTSGSSSGDPGEGHFEVVSGSILGAAGGALAGAVRGRTEAVVAGAVVGALAGAGLGYVAEVRRRYGLSLPLFARASNLSERTIRQYEKTQEPLSDSQLRTIRELDHLHAALSRIVDPSEIGPWLDRPNPMFEGLKPIELLERGQADRLWRMVYYLESGSPS